MSDRSTGGRFRSSPPSPTMGARDPRTRTNAQSESSDKSLGAFMKLDALGRLSVDIDALKAELGIDQIRADVAALQET